jgi:hypothetical protein
MVDDAGSAQARTFLKAMHAQVQEITARLEKVERRDCRTSARGAAIDRRHRAELRRELYEAHRLIDGLHRRFPECRVGG